jgi:hypothetical protein
VYKNIVSTQQKARYGDSWFFLLKEVIGVYSVNLMKQLAKNQWGKKMCFEMLCAIKKRFEG